MHLALLLVSSQLAWGAALNARQSSQDDCATAMELVQSSNYQINALPVIDGQTAYDCLLSLPFNRTKAKTFVTEIKKYVQFQSTLEVLKDPPSSYLSPAVDILGGLDKITSNDYNSHYEFDTDIATLFNSAHDGHLSIAPCSTKGYQFYRASGGLASFSSDGLGLPDIYETDDIPAVIAGSSRVSPVTSINGQSAIEYLEGVASSVRSQDPDARWNKLFTSNAAYAANSNSPINYLGNFVFQDGIWPGTSNTRLQFRNGSTRDIPTMAYYAQAMAATSSDSLLSLLCDPPSSNTNSRRDLSAVIENKRAATTSVAAPRTYPTPTTRDPNNLIIGYNLDSDTDVMFIPNFDSKPEDGISPLSKIATNIVDKAKADGRTKLIIDLSANGGGTIARAFDLFKLFFPSKLPYSANRMRRHDVLDIILLGLQNQVPTGEVYSPFWWKEMVKPQQDSSFDSVQDVLNGGTQRGTNVTSLFANFNYTLSSANSKMAIRGYAGTPINNTDPFKAEDILIITDGICASTCTTFVNLMTNVGGVRAVTFGGRPRTEPMQVMGGVRGGQVYKFTEFDRILQLAVNNIKSNKDLVTQSQLELGDAAAPDVNVLPFKIPRASVNLRDAYQEGDDHLPLQFAYQASDCRLFYTAKSIQEPADVWSRAKAAVWGDKGCVKDSNNGQGSLNNRTSDGEGNGKSGDGKEEKKNGSEELRPGRGLWGVLALVYGLLASM